MQKRSVFLSLALVALASTRASTQRLEDSFTPNAPVCVKFDQRGNPTAALVNGSRSNRRLNKEMLALLRKGTWWGADYRGTGGKWVALSVAPNGYPVPEISPSCPAR